MPLFIHFMTLTLTISIILIISASSWFHLWLSLEMNMMSFIGLVLHSNNFHQAMIKYFLTQAMGSSIFIISSSLTSLSLTNINLNFNMMPSIAMIIKLGLIPFHFWYPEVMNLINWFHCMVLSTLQKLGPLSILFSLNSNMTLFAILSLIFGGLYSLNQTSLRKLMSYSSISHNSWMVMAISLQINLWYIYFLVYSIINMTTMYIMNKSKWYHINQIDFQNRLDMLMFTITLMTLGGLPPTLGFIPKWSILFISSYTTIYISIIMIMNSTIMLYTYMMIMYKPIMLMKMKQTYNMNQTSYSTVWFFLLTISITPTIFL